MAEFHPLRSIDEVVSPNWKNLDRIAEKRAREVPSASMPKLEHASIQDFDLVYEPSDDTYLLIDGIQDDVTTNRSIYERYFQTILEIGCGSGVPIVHLAKLLPNVTPIASSRVKMCTQVFLKV